MQDRTVKKKGIISNTPLYRVPAPFNPILSVPPDEFHLGKEGLAKLIFKRLFEDTNTAESREVYEEFNDAFVAAAVVKELGRCTRSINTKGMKGSELGLLLHSGFPYLIELMNDRRQDHW